MSDDNYEIDPGYFTLIIKGDITKLSQVPLLQETPYGMCVGVGVGSSFDERDYWEARARKAEKELDDA